MDTGGLRDTDDQTLPVALILQVHLGREHLEADYGATVQSGMCFSREECARAKYESSEAESRSHGSENGDGLFLGLVFGDGALVNTQDSALRKAGGHWFPVFGERELAEEGTMLAGRRIRGGL